jgi:hypothetical protein
MAATRKGVLTVAGLVDAEHGRTPFGIDLALGTVAMVAAVAVAAPFPGIPARVVIVSLALGVFTAFVDDPRAAAPVAVLGYLLFDGFLVNRFGDLTWSGTTSVWPVAAFLAAVGLGLGWRWLRRARARAAFAADLAEVLGAEDSDRSGHP